MLIWQAINGIDDLLGNAEADPRAASQKQSDPAVIYPLGGEAASDAALESLNLFFVEESHRCVCHEARGAKAVLASGAVAKHTSV
tara:strand:+ start:152 stop:406 length:255 start_codon:yes stop_codon:yes gene_type:complete